MRRVFRNNYQKWSMLLALVVFLPACSAVTMLRRYQHRPRRVSASAIGARSDLQKMIDAARPGDTITLEAGVTYLGPITLPKKMGEQWITIQSSALDKLPAGQRVGVEHAALMPKIISPGDGEPALRTSPGAHHYRFVGIEFTTATPDDRVTDLVTLGEGDQPQTTLESVPHHLVIDRCYLHAWPQQNLKRGISLQSGETEITNNYLSDFKARGQDAQGICGWNGPGPYKIINNYIEGSGENVMFGGADALIPNLIPSDIEFSRNTVRKPLAWRGQWTAKNLFELKNAQRVHIEGNVFENSWPDAQVGYAIVLTPRNEDGRSPWNAVRDVVFTNNIVRNMRRCVQILGQDYIHPSAIAERLTITNNLFDGGAEGGGWFLLISIAGDAPRNLRVEHNTVIHAGHLIYTTGEKNGTCAGLIYRNNINTGSSVGGDDNPGWGTKTLDYRFPGYIFQANVLLAGELSAAWFPPTTWLSPNLDAIGFVNPAAGDYRLASTSHYRGRGTDGKDLGCDFNQLKLAIDNH